MGSDCPHGGGGAFLIAKESIMSGGANVRGGGQRVAGLTIGDDSVVVIWCCIPASSRSASEAYIATSVSSKGYGSGSDFRIPLPILRLLWRGNRDRIRGSHSFNYVAKRV